MAEILLVDDEREIRSTLASALGRRGHRVDTASSISAARHKTITRYGLILLDVMLPDGDGIDLLTEIVAVEGHPPVVMISGHSGIETAVKAIQIGAADFLEKPLSLDRVLITITNVLTAVRLREENTALAQTAYGEIVGTSTAIRSVMNEATVAAPRSTRFLILGENGTGKELLARLIHQRSRYASGRFVPVNSAALPAELVESELFGHIKGSFTGAIADKIGRFSEADHGTIFLDEIADMSHDAQAKILRVIENGELRPVGSGETVRVELNVVAATNRQLETRVAEGLFRQDLLFRLNVVTLQLPSLRERQDDIPLLFKYYLERFASQAGKAPVALSDDAVEFLAKYGYPGNVRELKNIAERITIYIDKPVATRLDILPLMPSIRSAEIIPLHDATSGFEADYIRRTLDICGGNVTEAARKLGLERSHLYKKMKSLDMT